MRKLNPLLAGATFALAALSPLAHAAGKNWLTNFEEAKKKAASEKKDLLVDFTGSDWCHWCIKLSEEVFQKEEFSKNVTENFILLELDYPNDKSKQSAELQKQNEELQKRFNIQGFPTVLLLDPQGRPYAQTGYQEGGPEAYLKSLGELKKLRTQRDEQFAAAEKLEGLEKAKALVSALEKIPVPYHGEFYGDIASKIISLDPNDETGYGTIKKAQFFEKQYVTAMQSGNIAQALKLVDEFITETKPTGPQLQQCLAMKMDPLLGSQQFETAAKVMEEIIAIDPENEMGKMALNFKPELAKMKKEAAEATQQKPSVEEKK